MNPQAEAFAAIQIEAAKKVAQVRDDPKGRLELRKEFYRKYGFNLLCELKVPGDFGFGNSELAFLNWEIRRGVLTRSAWWSNVNEDFLVMSEGAAMAWEQKILADNVDGATRLWFTFFDYPTAKSWYRAHNGSIVRGYRNRMADALLEPRTEQIFVNMVLYRLLFAQFLAEAGRTDMNEFLLLHPGALPQLPVVDLLVHSRPFYPDTYPIEEQHTSLLHRFIDGDLLGGELANILDQLFIQPRIIELYGNSTYSLAVPELSSWLRDEKPIYPVVKPAEMSASTG